METAEETEIEPGFRISTRHAMLIALRGMYIPEPEEIPGFRKRLAHCDYCWKECVGGCWKTSLFFDICILCFVSFQLKNAFRAGTANGNVNIESNAPGAASNLAKNGFTDEFFKSIGMDLTSNNWNVNINNNYRTREFNPDGTLGEEIIKTKTYTTKISSPWEHMKFIEKIQIQEIKKELIQIREMRERQQREFNSDLEEGEDDDDSNSMDSDDSRRAHYHYRQRHFNQLEHRSSNEEDDARPEDSDSDGDNSTKGAIESIKPSNNITKANLPSSSESASNTEYEIDNASVVNDRITVIPKLPSEPVPIPLVENDISQKGTRGRGRGRGRGSGVPRGRGRGRGAATVSNAEIPESTAKVKATSERGKSIARGRGRGRGRGASTTVAIESAPAPAASNTITPVKRGRGRPRKVQPIE